IEAFKIDADFALAQRILRQVEREAVGVVELEGSLTVQPVACIKRGRGIGKKIEAARQCLAKACFLKLERLGNECFAANELRISLPHFANESRHEAPHQRLLGAEQLAVAHGAAHDATEHITPALI